MGNKRTEGRERLLCRLIMEAVILFQCSIMSISILCVTGDPSMSFHRAVVDEKPG